MSYASVVLADTPAGYWRLGESTGTSAADGSGNAHAGTYTNTPTLGVAGAIQGDSDTAVGFTAASSQYVAPSLLFNQAIASIEAWIKLTVTPAANRTIVGCVNGLGNGTYDKMLVVKTDGKPYFYAFDGAGKTTSSPPFALPLNQWVHLCGVADGTNLHLYANGVEYGSVACGNTFTGYTVPNVFISGNTTGGFLPTTYFEGQMDEAAIYASALTPTQVLNHYLTGAPGYSKLGTSSGVRGGFPLNHIHR